ncbi:sulfonate transport system substrate-binding protein [Verrucomicrobium sp. GAS474]|uniref:aliphatic sulfonate ABC transporter substrate-binding protein n=1 Tax=Verrucomicrobium sp. GAS474 TaxID=1882831 RepID=UPI00087B1E88|nr:aliphatic sulfonate ABC transporter substrate-binding protein [Verrucomicrobium sp. GAS474]SDT97258.1 sulfonate transport system substrate-binding protein [Verrucomicrobium sp. GAS474]
MIRTRLFKHFAAALLLAVGASSVHAETLPSSLKIGFQKYGTFPILKARGDFEKRLAALGVKVEWVQFPAGVPILEALNANSVQLGETGEAPPVFAQAAGVPLVYVAYEPKNSTSEAILVPKNSPIRTVADLKGKKVAVTKGSNANYFLAKALEGAGLKYSDITPVYLIPGDGLAALGSGAVDAYSVWEPYQTVATRSHDARELLNGEKTIANYEYFLARRDFAETSPKILAILKEETNKADAWALQNPRAVAELLAPELKVDADTLEVVAKKQARGLQDPDDTVLAYQQSLADTFLSIGLISKPIAVKDAFLGKTATTAAK